ncbi:MAG: hypothetical protein QXL15_02090, partial [Candidatus Korarchaeota archaeon]
MAIIEVNLGELFEVIGKRLTIEELENILFDMGLELESYENDMIAVDITMDRPDLLSVWGLGDAIRKYIGIKSPDIPKVTSSGIIIHVDKSVMEIRPYIAAFLARNLSITEGILKNLIYMQEKLHDTFCRNRVIASIGLYPFHEIVPPLRYVAVPPEEINFTPLGANRNMNGYEILKYHETGIKYAFILEGHSRFPLFVDSV